MNNNRITNPNNNKVREYKSRTTEIIVNQKPFTIEDLSVKYTLECPEYFKDKKAFRCSLIGEQITACNMPYFEITSINKL